MVNKVDSDLGTTVVPTTQPVVDSVIPNAQDVTPITSDTTPYKVYNAFDVKNNTPIQIDETQLDAALKDGQIAFDDNERFNVVGPDQSIYQVTGPSELQTELGAGARLATPDEVRNAQLESQYGDRPLAAASVAAASSATFSLSDRALIKSGLMTPEQLNALREHNPDADILGQIGGLLTGTGAVKAGGELAAKGLAKAGAKRAAEVAAKSAAAASKLSAGNVATQAGLRSQAVAKRLVEGALKNSNKTFVNSVIQKSIPLAVGGATEGAIVGGSQLLREEALGNTELNAESVLSHVGMGAVLGGATGGLFGAVEASIPVIKQGVGGAVDLVKGRARDSLQGTTSIKDAGYKIFGITPDRALKLETKSPRFASEFEDFIREKVDLGVFTGAKDLRKQVDSIRTEAQSVLAKSLDDVDSLGTDQIKSLFRKDNIAKELIKKLDDQISPLRTSKFVDSKDIKFLTNLRSKFENDLNYYIKRGDFDTKLRPSYTTQQLFDEMNNVQNMITKRGRFTGKDPVQNALADIKTYIRNKLDQGVEMAEVANPGSTVIDQLKKARRDYWITTDIKDSISKKALREANSSLVSLKELLSGGALSLATGNLGVGAAAAAAVRFAQSDLKARLTILSQINKSKIMNDKVIKSAIELYTKGAAASKIAAHNVKRISPTLSVGILNTLNLDPKNKNPKSEKDKLQAFHVFRKQLQNLHDNPEELMHTLARKTLLLNKVAPLTADALEATTINGISFLYEKMPRPMKDTIGLQSNLQQYRVSNFELSKYERYVEAVTNPMSVMRNLAEGKISREGVEALKVVYPTMFQDIQSKIIEQVGTMEEVLPYQKRVQLSIIFELPLDESMESANIIGLQQQFGMAQQQRDQQAQQTQSTQMTNSARILSNSSIAEREASNAQKIEQS